MSKEFATLYATLDANTTLFSSGKQFQAANLLSEEKS